jgi:hypothetical protein
MTLQQKNAWARDLLDDVVLKALDHPLSHNINEGCTMRRIPGITKTVIAIAGVVSLSSPFAASAEQGIAQGETTQQKSQQGHGLGGSHELGSHGAQGSNVIMGGPDIIMGRISKIDGDKYSIAGDRGQEISLRVTKDTNIVCAGSQQAKFSTGQESDKEHQEIAPTPFMEQQAKKGGQGQQAMNDQQMAEQHRQRGESADASRPSKDPSQLKDKVGTTDPKAKEDVARGSGFKVGDCDFKVGDTVRVEGSDMGTATTIKQLASERR